MENINKSSVLADSCLEFLAVPSYRRVRCRVPSGVEEGKGHVFREISNRERVITKCRKEECKDKNEMRVLGLFLALFAGDVAEMEWQQVEVRGFFFSSITEAVKITQPKTNRSTDAKTYAHINVHAHTNTNERARRPSHTQPGTVALLFLRSCILVALSFSSKKIYRFC